MLYRTICTVCGFVSCPDLNLIHYTTSPLFLKHRFLIPTSDAAAIKQRDADSKNIASPSENPVSATFG
ncbi:hypothetical protein HMPREF3156_01788 [Neisseria sp. HMSC06F02]|nr:hypothetical protein HMPREF3156_01788 [Neisseria sp. HMSC06F02]